MEMDHHTHHHRDEDKLKPNKNHHIFLSILLLLLGLIFQSTIWNHHNEDPIVETYMGKLMGRYATSRMGKKYKEFLAIPYAKAPFRFQPPQPAEPWNGIRSAQTLGPECLSLEFLTTGRVVGQEDCLYLNVYVPENNDNETFSSSKSVIVYIHGGGFVMGSSYIHGARYFLDEDIILVTLNYRLGPFGFLNTGDNIIRGNMAFIMESIIQLDCFGIDPIYYDTVYHTNICLKDQAMALRWVKENIGFFGGDSDRITLVGESAGGISTHLHMMSPLSKGLFKKAISMSGTAANVEDMLIRNHSEVAARLGSKLNCPTLHGRQLVECLQSASAHDIVSTQLDTLNPFASLKDFFLPSVELIEDSDTFLSTSPMESLKTGKNYNPVDWMVGLLNSEGLIYVLRLIQNNINPVILKQRSVWKQYMSHLLLLDDKVNAEEISEKIYDFYFGHKFHPDNQTDEQVMSTLVNVFSDKFFYSGAHYAAQAHTRLMNDSSVYLYYLTHQMRMNVFDVLSMTSPGSRIPFEMEVGFGLVKKFCSLLFRWGDDGPPPKKRACHGDDINLIFDTNFFIEMSMSAEDVHMSRSLVRVIADFAKDSEPLQYGGITWPPMDGSQKDLMLMKLDASPKLITSPFTEDKEKFWNSLGIF